MSEAGTVSRNEAITRKAIPAAPAGEGYAVPLVDPADLAALTQFLGHEARLLDECRLEEWLGLLDPQIVYEIPLRQAAPRFSPLEYPEGAFRMRDDFAMLAKRVQRFSTGENWSEDPPSRTVRTIGSILAEPAEAPGVFTVHSALQLFRERAVDGVYDLIPARRRDRIRLEAGRCVLLARRVMLAETILRTPNLGVFL